MTKTRKFTMRCTEEELQLMHKLAEAQGMKVAAMIRRLVEVFYAGRNLF